MLIALREVCGTLLHCFLIISRVECENKVISSVENARELRGKKMLHSGTGSAELKWAGKKFESAEPLLNIYSDYKLWVKYGKFHKIKL